MSVRLRLAAVVILAGTLGLGSASESMGAAGYLKARFNVSISGAFRSAGSETNTQCHYEDVGGVVVPFTKTTDVSDSVRFASRGQGIVEVSSLAGRPPDAGMIKIPSGTATFRRARVSNTPRPCTPGGHVDSCGTKSRTVRFGIWGSQTSSALGYFLTKRSGPVFPDDPFPFSECRAVSGQIAWGKLSPRRAGVSRARLFNTGVRKIVVQGRYTARNPSFGAPNTADSSYTLQYTITLSRRG